MTKTLQTMTPRPLTARNHQKRQWLLGATAAATLSLLPPAVWATGQNLPSNALPGQGVTVQPLKSALAEESFQTLLVMKALEQLGYTVKPWEELDYPLIHIAVANGEATFMANHWNPHHAEFYLRAGGDAKLSRQGVYAAGAVQGYMIDKKTADAHGITHLDQLKDPQLAQLFDASEDGKADLIGPNAGWGGEAVVAHQIRAFGLQNTVNYTQGNYPALIADTLARFKAGKPVLYYAWTPYWLSNVLRPGHEVVWLQVPSSSMPGVQANTDTQLPNGKNYGFPLNNQYIVANKAWAAQHPAAAKLFEVMQIPLNDISQQNRLLHDGQNKPADIERHVNGWIKAHQTTLDAWLAQARAAATR